MRVLVGVALWGIGCAVSGGAWPTVPKTHYDQMGPRLRDERKVMSKGHGWWVTLPVSKGQTVIVDVVTTLPADIFLMDERGIAQYEATMNRAGGSAITHHGRKWTQHYTQKFTPDDDGTWWLLVDNTSFPNDGARGTEWMQAHVQIFEPSKGQALAEMESSCRSGNGDGCARAGYAYEMGEGTPKNHARAIDYYERGCEKSSPRGCFLLAYAYRDAIGKPRDDGRAVELFSRACGLGWIASCVILGRHYVEGRGVPRDEVRAKDYFQRACDKDDGLGCFDLAISLQDSDHVRAAEARGKACKLKMEQACGTGRLRRPTSPATATPLPPTTVSKAPPEAHDGTWRGTTSQSYPIVFTVEKGAVTSLATTTKAAAQACTVENTCPEGKPCAAVTPPPPVLQGTFSLVQAGASHGVAMRGTFSSTTAAYGELTIMVPATKNCPATTGSATWTAKKQ